MQIFGDGIAPSRMGNYLDILDGFTTNPSLAKKLGVTDYFHYCCQSAQSSGGKEVSVEVLADDTNEIIKQARLLSKIGENVFVKVPIINSSGENNIFLINQLREEGIKINITAIFHMEDVLKLETNISTPTVLSVFAGRLADIRIDPMPIVENFVNAFHESENIRILWASTREVFNIQQAKRAKVDIITVTEDILQKYHKYSEWDTKKIQLDTVEMFLRDSKDSGFHLETQP